MPVWFDEHTVARRWGVSEAGHAVISMKLGYRCLYVTITPDGDRLGHVCCEGPRNRGHDDKIKHALKVLIAASLAESKHIGSPTWGDADDRVKATNLALLATERATEHAKALINEMIGEARKLVERHWSDIEKLAEQLLVEGRICHRPVCQRSRGPRKRGRQGLH